MSDAVLIALIICGTILLVWGWPLLVFVAFFALVAWVIYSLLTTGIGVVIICVLVFLAGLGYARHAR